MLRGRRGHCSLWSAQQQLSACLARQHIQDRSEGSEDLPVGGPPHQLTPCPVLQAFLRGIVSHPVLRDSEALKLFLLQPGELSYNPAWIALLHSIGSECGPPSRRTTAIAPSRQRTACFRHIRCHNRRAQYPQSIPHNCSSWTGTVLLPALQLNAP